MTYGMPFKNLQGLFFVLITVCLLYYLILYPTPRGSQTIRSPESGPVTKQPKWEYNPSVIFPPEWYAIPRRADPTCPAKRNLYFLRTHQTGTSSVSNILYRHGQEHRLNFVMYPLKLHLNYPGRVSMSYLEGKGVRPRDGYNILCQYTRHHTMDALRILPDGVIFSTLLRHPVDQFLSVFHNFDIKSEIRNLQPHHNAYEEFFRNPHKISMMSSDSIFHLIQNSMSFDLGLNPPQFKDDAAVEKFIQAIDNDFHIVMILELLDESLVLFRRLMCWSLDQMVYVKLSMNMEYSSGISDEIRDKILDWNSVDYKLYTHFYNKMKRIIGEQDEDFQREVVMLKSLNSEFWKECYDKVMPVYNGNKLGYILSESHKDNRTCKLLATDDVTQTHLIGMKQFKDSIPPSDILMVRNHMQNLRKHNPAMLGWQDVYKILHPEQNVDAKHEL